MIFNLMKPVPVQDEPTMYLYGREANKTVNCNGIIVPSLPEWDKAAYPYAVMVYDTGENLRLMVFSVPAVASETEYNYVRVYPNADGYYCMWYGTNDNLEQLSKDVAIDTSAYGMSIHDGFTVWSNHDICFEDGTIFISASDPVTTYENAEVYIGDVGYVGAVLPPLPVWDKEQYPYAVICKYLNVFGSVIGYDIVVSNRPLFMTKDESPNLWQPSGTNSSITMSAKLYLDRTVDDTPPGEWGKWGSPYDSYGPGARWWDEPIWADYDVELCDGYLKPMGETALSATKPIPVELVGYSYNGTVLPALPEWDKETYPYAVITGSYVNYFGEILYALALTQTPCTYDEETGYIITEKREYFLSSTFRWAKGKWSNVERYKMASDWANRDDFVWTNHDIVNADGSVHYLASNPVPVYE